MIDQDGFRPNVGIIICNGQRRLLWARRLGRNGWQFPQGGIRADESAEDALYRELQEEVGLQPGDVRVMARSEGWLHYRLPRRYLRRDRKPLCLGQKQKWFLLRLEAGEERVRLDASDSPEFDEWRWVDYWHPLEKVIFFKRTVYEAALEEFLPVLFPEGGPPKPNRGSDRDRRRRGPWRRRRRESHAAGKGTG